jgi:hypothetical protein
LRTAGRRRPRGGSGSAAFFAGLLARNLDRRLGAFGGFLERNLEVVAQIGAALRAAAPPAAAAEQIAEAEHVAEDVREVAELGEDRRIESGTAGRGGADAGVAEAVVETALLRVGEDRVGLRALLEFFLGELVARVAVRVKLHRQSSI